MWELEGCSHVFPLCFQDSETAEELLLQFSLAICPGEFEPRNSTSYKYRSMDQVSPEIYVVIPQI